MDSKQKKYEIAFLLSPSIAEEAVLVHTQKVTAALEAGKAIISHAETPRKRRLAYPIGKETNAYFGWIKFTAPVEAIAEINKKIKLEKSTLRFLIVEDTIQIMMMPRMPRMTAPTIAPTQPKREEETAERLDLEGLDKKLEEILGK